MALHAVSVTPPGDVQGQSKLAVPTLPATASTVSLGTVLPNGFCCISIRAMRSLLRVANLICSVRSTGLRSLLAYQFPSAKRLAG